MLNYELNCCDVIAVGTDTTTFFLLDVEGGYHGYWASDLYGINENYGTADDLKSLVNAAHQRVSHMRYALVTGFTVPLPFLK